MKEPTHRLHTACDFRAANGARVSCIQLISINSGTADACIDVEDSDVVRAEYSLHLGLSLRRQIALERLVLRRLRRSTPTPLKP